jgi:tetratricopeptide (TPR) repeat protein
VPVLLAGEGSIRVKCVDSTGNMLQGVKVIANRLNDNRSKDKNSDALGIAEISKLDAGVYRVFGRKNGFSPALFEFAMLQTEPISITLALQTGADKKLYFEDFLIGTKADELQKLATQAQEAGDLERAQKLFEQSIDINPPNPEVLLKLASVYLEQMKFDPMLEALNKVVMIATAFRTLPASPYIREASYYDGLLKQAQVYIVKIPAMKGQLAMVQKKYDVAIAAYSDAVKEDPNNPVNHVGLAIALTNVQRNDEALQAVGKAIQLNPGEKKYADLKNQIEARKAKSKSQ